MPPCGPPEATTLIESVPEGWWYSAHLPSGQHVLAFMSDPGIAPPASLPPHIALRVRSGAWKTTSSTGRIKSFC